MEVINKGILKALEMLGLDNKQPQQGSGLLSTQPEIFSEFNTKYDPVIAPRAVGKDTVSTAIDRVSSVLGDTNKIVKPLMLYTVNRESKYGTDPNTFKKRTVKFKNKSGNISTGTVGHGGVAQVTSNSFRNIVNKLSNASEKTDAGRVSKKLETAGLLSGLKRVSEGNNEGIERFLETPFNSVLLGRLQYRINNRALPKNEQGFKKYYEDIYRGR